MTTVAVTRTHIAADTMATRGDEILCEDEEKIIPKDGVIFAITGAACLFEPLIEWYRAGAIPKDLPDAGDNKWQLIVVKDVGDTVDVYCNSPYRDIYMRPIAFGSGRSYAQAALVLGRTAMEAIELAIQLDLQTGGEVSGFDIAVALAY